MVKIVIINKYNKSIQLLFKSYYYFSPFFHFDFLKDWWEVRNNAMKLSSGRSRNGTVFLIRPRLRCLFLLRKFSLLYLLNLRVIVKRITRNGLSLLMSTRPSDDTKASMALFSSTQVRVITLNSLTSGTQGQSMILVIFQLGLSAESCLINNRVKLNVDKSVF